MLDMFEEGNFEKMCTGILSSTIEAHGPITHQTKGSAAKRFACQFRAFLKQFHTEDIKDASIVAEIEELNKELNKSKAKVISQGKQIAYLIDKLKETGVFTKNNGREIRTTDSSETQQCPECDEILNKYKEHLETPSLPSLTLGGTPSCRGAK
jgi:uncharacterized coiled-coil protein SlyX